MILNIDGVTEETYGLWHNHFPQKVIPVIESEDYVPIYLGFDSNNLKKFDLDINKNQYQFFMKVSSDKDYDMYRDHLIVLVKMIIFGAVGRDVTVNIFIVSDKHESYKNELWTFFNMSNSYNRYRSFGQHGVLIKNLSMGFLGYRITDFFIKLIGVFRRRVMGFKE